MVVVEVGQQLAVEAGGHLPDGPKQAAALVGDLQAGGVPMTLAAALLLGLVILPAQAAVVAGLHEGGAPTVPPRLGMTTGVFALIWAVVVVLMIVRPGSTTGVGA